MVQGIFISPYTGGGGMKSILLLGTSNNEVLCNFIPYSTARMKYIRINGGQLNATEQWKLMKHYKKEILSYKPDILILSISALDYPELRNITKK